MRKAIHIIKGVQGYSSGNYFIFRFKLFVFKAIFQNNVFYIWMSNYIMHISLLPGHLGQGLKKQDCSWKSGILGSPEINLGLYTNRYSNVMFFLYFHSCEITLSNFVTERLIFQRFLWEVNPANPSSGQGHLWLH